MAWMTVIDNQKEDDIDGGRISGPEQAHRAHGVARRGDLEGRSSTTEATAEPETSESVGREDTRRGWAGLAREEGEG